MWEKIRDDHFVSKLGEEAVRILFEARNCQVEGPDYGVYEAKRKSWAADMKVNGLEVAVKTQRRSFANRYGLSWTFQDSPERRDPILDVPDAWVCLVVFEDLKSETECLVYPLRKIKQLIFEAPRLAKLVGKKQAVYLETFSNSLYENLLGVLLAWIAKSCEAISGIAGKHWSKTASWAHKKRPRSSERAPGSLSVTDLLLTAY